MGRRLRALEQAVGQTLFQRTGEGFILTAEGSAMLNHAERVEEEVLAIQRQLSGKDQHLEGMIRLSSSDWFGVHMLTPVLAEFGRLHPRVVVELVTSVQHFSLPRREADMVFRIRPFDDPDVISRRLLHIPYGVYMKSDLERPRAGDGSGTSLITLDTALEDMPDAIWLKRMLPNAHIAARSNNRDVQGRMCVLGAGVAVLPRPLGDVLSGVERINLGEDPPGRDTWVGYHRDMRRQARLRALLDLIIERLSTKAHGALP